MQYEVKQEACLCVVFHPSLDVCAVGFRFLFILFFFGGGGGTCALLPLKHDYLLS